MAEEKNQNEKIGEESPWDILLFPHTSEKSIGLIEKENTIVFIVDRRANKPMIKKAFEKAFNVKVDKVRTLITRKNEKKAFIKINKKYSAGDIAIRLGII
jgi:large subunit ribosomal protein L23